MGRSETSVKSSFDRLAAINRAITTSLNFNEALRLIVDNAAELFAADNSLLLLVDDDGILRVKAAHVDRRRTFRISPAAWKSRQSATCRAISILDPG